MIYTLLSTLSQLLHYILKCTCNYIGMTTVSFLSKLLAFLMRNCFPKRTSGATLLTFSKLYDVSVFEAVYCYISDRNKGGCCSISDDVCSTCKASVTIVAGFSPEFDPPFLWRIKHQTKNDCIYL